MTDDGSLFSAETRRDIQGFITSGFGHLPFTAYLVIEIRDARTARTWLGELLPAVTTSASWRSERGAPKVKPRRALNVAFSHAGLRALGLSPTALDSFPVEFQEGIASEDRSRILGDSGPSVPTSWELGGPAAPPIHAFLILHGATGSELDEARRAQRALLARVGAGLVEHAALAQAGELPDHRKEPFGFFDGIAQPQVRGINGEGVASGEFVLGHVNEYGFFPVGPLVPAVDDPNEILPASRNPHHRDDGWRDLGRNGAFVAYRKLQQDVAAFWRFLQSESKRLKGVSDARFMIWLAAKMVGRWPDGTPLPLSPDRMDGDLARRDDFFHAQDPHGFACPVGSHIRRTNPRDHLRPHGRPESLHMSARHRLLRRGRPYGPTLFDVRALDRMDNVDALRCVLDLQDDGQGRGLHFLCIIASLSSQFEFVQQSWCNNPRFNGLVDNPDPMTGNTDPTSPAPGTMYIPARPVGVRTSPLPRFVTVRGGAYLFMPSLTALRFLSAGV